jgi:hypothetical protein
LSLRLRHWPERVILGINDTILPPEIQAEPIKTGSRAGDNIKQGETLGEDAKMS